MMKTAVVLGAGPAGLMAVHALVHSRLFGEVRVLARGEKSTMYGAQYLHQPIPDIFVPSTVVRQVLKGEPEEYARKVYGELYDPLLPNSVEQYDGDRKAWDIRSAYNMLWAKYSDRIENIDYSDKKAMSESISRLFDSNSLLFNTMPRQLLCTNVDHQFKKMAIWAVGDAPDLGVTAPFSCHNDSIVCNGMDVPSWYRASKVFGMTTVEWPDASRPPIDHVVQVSKPISTNCDCWPLIKHYGRYGQWKKGVLAHTAFFEVRDWVEQMMRQGILY